MITRMGWERGLRVLLLLAAATALVSWLKRSEDFIHYLEVGNAVLEGRDIYADTPTGVNTWPPVFSFLCAILAASAKANPVLAKGAWLLLNYAVLVGVLGLLARMVYNRPFTLGVSTTALTITSPEIVVPLILAGAFVSAVFEYSQVDLIIFALALTGLYLLRSGRPVPGGLSLGAAAALKVTPVLFIPYFIWRRQWRNAAWTTMWTALLTLSPAIVFGWNRYVQYLSSWVAVVGRGWDVGKFNQSVFAMWDRILGHGIIPFSVPGAVLVPKSGAPSVQMAWLLSIAVVTVIAMILFRNDRADPDWVQPTEFGVVFIVAGFFGTVTWKHHAVALLFPYTVLFAACRATEFPKRLRHQLLVALVAAGALGLTAAHDLVGGAMGGRMEMGSSVTFTALILLTALFWLRAALTDEDAATRHQSA
ncbi:MAG TPA: glycosyltransferase family 87 protein [Gemmatimonadales bacterium]|nr:glycosyltransferase family 87 protein [Gemmatimonadales bacterium]